MDKETLEAKMQGIMQPRECGSGKAAYQCCKKGEATEIGNETCLYSSGLMVKDCCMANPEAHHKEINFKATPPK